MISVVLPAYNRRNTVRKAVESVLNQTERDIECIVVDDASTDDTAGVLTEISDSRLRIIRLTENSGACHARNVGVQAAKGEYIAFQDSDDCFHPDKLERQLAFLQETGADVVFCGMNRICGQQMEVFPAYVPDKCINRIDLLEANLASTQCIFGKAEAFRNTPFDEDMPRLQDWALMLELAKKYIVRGEATPLVDVYVQPDSLSNQPKKLFPALRRIYLRYAETINEHQPEQRRRQQDAEGRKDQREHRACDGSSGDLTLHALGVSGTIGRADKDAGTEAETVDEEDGQRHQRVGGADGGKGVFADKFAHDDAVGGVISELEQVAQHQRDGEFDQKGRDGSGRHVFCHGSLLFFFL